MNACVQHFHFEPGTLIAYEGYEVVVTGSVRGGIAVRDRWIGADESVRHYVLSDAKVQELLLRPDVVIDAAFAADAPGDLPVVSTETAFSDYVSRRRQLPFFANARSVRNALDRARLRQANRLFSRMGEALTKQDLITIEEADIRASRVFKGEVEGHHSSQHGA